MGARWTCLFLVVHLTSLLLMSKGQTCFFTETTGQKGSEMLHSDSANTTTLSACKTLCNTTELCIAGEFLSTTNTCHIYLVETSLTGQTGTVFFQWDCTNETATTATTTTSTITPSTTMLPISTTPTFVSSSAGQTCFFTETAGQKGSDSLRSDSATVTSLSACKTLCNTTELCIAGEFLSTTNTCHIYLVETSLTGQTGTVFFQWDCTNETATTATTTTSTTTMQTTTTTTQPTTTTTSTTTIQTTTTATTTTTMQPTTISTTTTTMQPTTTTTPTTTMQPTTTTTATTTMQPTSTTTSTTTMQPTTTTPTTTTTTSRTTPTATTTTTTTPASMTTITPTLDNKRSGPSPGPQHGTEGAIAAALASFAVLMCIPCLMCIILCRKNDNKEDGRWVIYKGPGLRESLKKEIFIKRLSIQTMSTEIRG